MSLRFRPRGCAMNSSGRSSSVMGFLAMGRQPGEHAVSSSPSRGRPPKTCLVLRRGGRRTCPSPGGETPKDWCGGRGRSGSDRALPAAARGPARRNAAGQRRHSVAEAKRTLEEPERRRRERVGESSRLGSDRLRMAARHMAVEVPDRFHTGGVFGFSCDPCDRSSSLERAENHRQVAGPPAESERGHPSGGVRNAYEIRRASCVRVFTSSFRNALRRWYSTVLGLMNS